MPSPETHPDTSRTISYTKRTNVIRAEIRNLKRLGPLPTDDDDYPGIDRELLDFELLLAAIDPPYHNGGSESAGLFVPGGREHELRPGVVLGSPHRHS